jgi:hypothetical protein
MRPEVRKQPDIRALSTKGGTIVEDELVFAGQAEWDSTMIDVEILLTQSADVLIGTAFFNGYVVQLDYKANTVRLEKAL